MDPCGIFVGLSDKGVLQASPTISHYDGRGGVDALCVCGGMCIFSIVFVWPFDPEEDRRHP